MSDAMSVAEINEQYVELLPARTVLSGGGGFNPEGDALSAGGDGGNGGLGVNVLSGIGILGHGSASAADGGHGGDSAALAGNLFEGR